MMKNLYNAQPISHAVSRWNILLLSIFLCRCASAVKESNHLQLEKTILLPGVQGRMDHIALDSSKQVAYLTALGNNTVEVIDLKAGKVIHSITNTSEPQGILFMPQNNVVFVANGGNGLCQVFQADTYALLHFIQLPGDADNVRYQASTKQVYVGYGSGGIAVIDASSFQKVKDIRLSGHPESFQIAAKLGKIFVNVPDSKQVEVIDVKELKVIAQWKVKAASANFPMALDETHHLLFIGCRHPAKLVVMSADDGAVVSTLDCTGDADDIFYNARKKEIYISGGAGFIDVFRQINPRHYELVEQVPTRRGARTCLFVSETKQLLLAVPASVKGKAELRIYQVRHEEQ